MKRASKVTWREITYCLEACRRSGPGFTAQVPVKGEGHKEVTGRREREKQKLCKIRNKLFIGKYVYLHQHTLDKRHLLRESKPHVVVLCSGM